MDKYGFLEVRDMLGFTFDTVTFNSPDEINFKGQTSFQLFHDQDCCEDVEVESIIGDLTDLENEPLLMAEEVTVDDENPKVNITVYSGKADASPVIYEILAIPPKLSTATGTP